MLMSSSGSHVTRHWREMDSNFRFLDLGRAFFTPLRSLEPQRAREPQPGLRTDNGRFTARRARLAPAMACCIAGVMRRPGPVKRSRGLAAKALRVLLGTDTSA